jgi:hypothetical protein
MDNISETRGNVKKISKISTIHHTKVLSHAAYVEEKKWVVRVRPEAKRRA